VDNRYSQRAADPEDGFARHLTFLYGPERVPTLLRRLRIILDQFQQRNPQFSRDEDGLTERDVILITYGDQVTEPGKPPLQTLAEVLEEHIKGVISGIHILPFFPYSSDDGFSIIDYSRTGHLGRHQAAGQ
jgi:sucrose phosphorylase